MSNDIPISKAVNIEDLSAQTEFTVTSGPCLLQAIYINVATSAHPTLLLDGLSIVIEIPGSQTAGSLLTFDNYKFDENLNCIINASATGSMTLIFVPETSDIKANVGTLSGDFVSVNNEYGLLSANGSYVIR